MLTALSPNILVERPSHALEKIVTMSSYKPSQSGLAPCKRDVIDLKSAADALGKTLVMGMELSFELQAIAQNPKHPFHANAEEMPLQTLVLLQGMLIAERWLIEFLLGPSLRGDKKRATDICVDCFNHDWRFPKGPVADELVARLSPINKLVLHPTWNLVNAAPRKWTLNRIARCIEGLDIFADGLQEKRPEVAKIFKSHVRAAHSVISPGPLSDRFCWFHPGTRMVPTAVTSPNDIGARHEVRGVQRDGEPTS